MTEPLSDKLNNQLVSRETGCGTDAQTTENNNAQSRNRFAPVFQIYLRNLSFITKNSYFVISICTCRISLISHHQNNDLR